MLAGYIHKKHDLPYLILFSFRSHEFIKLHLQAIVIAIVVRRLNERCSNRVCGRVRRTTLTWSGWFTFSGGCLFRMAWTYKIEIYKQLWLQLLWLQLSYALWMSDAQITCVVGCVELAYSRDRYNESGASGLPLPRLAHQNLSSLSEKHVNCHRYCPVIPALYM